MKPDSAGAYDSHAREFLGARDNSPIGARVVATWAGSLRNGIDVLEIGCGGGLPVSRALIDAGLRLWAVDSSPALLSVFHSRFPEAPVDCERVLDSRLFSRKFGAVIAVGLVFLLSTEDQEALIHRVSGVLESGGRFLFTAPVETGVWADITTGHECRSLGRERYEAILAAAGFGLIAEYEDEGRNHYYEAERIPAPRPAT